MSELKKLDLSQKEFKANGVDYYFESEVSIERFQEFERLQAHVGFGKDFENIYKRMKDAYENLNKGKQADAAVILHNLMNGIGESLENRDHPVLQMCALFINRKDENRAKFDKTLCEQKIKDWKEEGYSMNDFFQLAFNFVGGFIPIYNEIIQDISLEAEKMGKSTKKMAEKMKSITNKKSSK